MAGLEAPAPGRHAPPPEARQGRDDNARRRLLAMMPVNERRVSLAGISTAVLEGGSGPPVILLHGPAGYAAHWLRVIPGLVSGHRVIAPDLPGHGASEAAGVALDVDRILEWLRALIEQSCDAPPVLVGQLLGGAIAARFAAARPLAISRLVLVDSFGLGPFQPAPAFAAALSAFLAQPSEATHQGLWQHCAFDLDALRGRMGDAWDPFQAYNLDRTRSPSVQAALSALMAEFATAIPEAELARITVPASLIWGRHDRATALAVAEAASARFGWPLHVIEDCADDPPVEQPEALLRALRLTLDTADPASPGSGPASGDPQSAAAWDGLAAGYDASVTPTHLWLGHEGLRRAGLQPGMRFLDVAAGSGALAIPAARMGAQVLAVDQSPLMLDRLRERAQQEGLSIETRVMDGHALDLDDAGFDLAGSQFGVMLFPDMPRGIAELARVVKPGGRVLMTVYGDPRKIDFFAFLLRAIQAVRPGFTGPPLDPPPLPFQLQDPERLRRELAAAGLKDVEVETATERMEFRTGRELWDWQVRSNPIVESLLASLDITGDERDVIALALERQIIERAGGDGVAVLTSPINFGLGTR